MILINEHAFSCCYCLSCTDSNEDCVSIGLWEATSEDWLNPVAIQGAFEARALRIVVKWGQNVSQATSQAEGFYERSPDLLEAAVAHIQWIIVTKFVAKVRAAGQFIVTE